MTPDPMVLRIHRALNALAERGTTAQMASWLAGRGVTGHPQSRCGCPVAEYVHAETGAWIGVEGGSWDYTGRHGYRFGEMPEEVGELISEIDAGLHPNLTREVVTA